jgi:hypothetical protein
MKYQRALIFLSVLVALLSSVAAGIGVFGQGQGEPIPVTSLRGESVLLQGHGPYYYDSVSSAAQVIGGDYVTFFLAVPLLLLSIWLAARGSLRGRLLLSGTLGYFLYTYASISFLLAYNDFFLLYVAIFSLSLFAFVISLMSFDLSTLPAHFSPSTPRWPVAAFLFVLGVFLALNWLGNIILPSLLTGEPPYGLETYATLVIQALDLGVIVPAAFLVGVLWLRRSPYGYLLTPVLLIKAFTMSAALTAMIIGMLNAGVDVPMVDILMFPTIGLINIAVMWVVLKNVRSGA